MKRQLYLSLLLILSSSLAACSTTGVAAIDYQDEAQSSDLSQSQTASIVNHSGTIILSGSIPSTDAEYQDVNLRYAPLLGYASAPQSKMASDVHDYTPAINEYWLAISRDDNRVQVRRGDEHLGEYRIAGASEVTPGSYFVRSMDLNPSWYAPDEYFLSRELVVPSPGSSQRFRRGALGRAAIFASKDMVLHSSPVWTPEVGGIRLEQDSIKALFDLLGTGSRIEVR